MAMNKKEKAAMADLEQELAMARAMRMPSDPCPEPDLNPKEILSEAGFSNVVVGFDCNVVLGGLGATKFELNRYWSSSINHGRVSWRLDDEELPIGAPIEVERVERTGASQNMKSLYSSPELALRAARHQMARECAKALAGIDKAIEEARGNE